MALDEAPSKRTIVCGALRPFVRDGLCAASVRDIAAVSGTVHTGLYKFSENSGRVGALSLRALLWPSGKPSEGSDQAGV